MNDQEIRNYFKRRVSQWARIAYMGWATKGKHLTSDPSYGSLCGRGWMMGYKEGHDEAVEWMLNHRPETASESSE